MSGELAHGVIVNEPTAPEGIAVCPIAAVATIPPMHTVPLSERNAMLAPAAAHTGMSSVGMPATDTRGGAPQDDHRIMAGDDGCTVRVVPFPKHHDPFVMADAGADPAFHAGGNTATGTPPGGGAGGGGGRGGASGGGGGLGTPNGALGGGGVGGGRGGVGGGGEGIGRTSGTHFQHTDTVAATEHDAGEQGLMPLRSTDAHGGAVADAAE